jgi:5S rRNA maturation endonuclease (ribonuclease M5)
MGMRKFDKSDLKAIDGFASDLGKKYHRIKRHLTEEVTADNDLSRFDEMIEKNHLLPVATDWREISIETLKKLQCQRVIDTRSGETHLVIPIPIDGETKGLVRARWFASKEKGVRNYVNSKHGEKNWASKYGLIGYDLIRSMPAFKKYGILFIVEGPRDAMRLIELGIPTLSLLGANLWTAYKRDLIIALAPDLIVSLMDNDKPGRKAGKRLTASFNRRANFHCHELPKEKKIGKKLDPMTMTEPHLQKVWNEARRLVK